MNKINKNIKSINKPDNSSKKNKSISYIALALMSFISVWNFSNATNGFGYFEGSRSIIPWIITLILYFMPFLLITAELCSVFKDEAGGIGSWTLRTLGPKFAFFAGWIYWVINIPYISQKVNFVAVAINWATEQNASISDYPVWNVQVGCFIIFVIAVLIACRGVSIISKISTVAGIASFSMSILYIILTLSAPLLTNGHIHPIEFKLENFMPKDMSFIFNISILIFALGGTERIATYTKSVKDPARDFPRGLKLTIAMVSISCVFSTIAMQMMFESNISSDFITNGQYQAFEILGSYYNVGQLFLIIFAISNALQQFAVIILSLDIPIRVMLSSADKKYYPSGLFKKNKNGCYINGMILQFCLVSIFIVLPVLGLDNVDIMVKWIIKLNSVCMPLSSVLVFIIYIIVRLKPSKFPNSGYKMIKSKRLALIIGCICLFINVFAIVFGMYDDNLFGLLTNILAPFVLASIGLIMPVLAKIERRKK